jgi:hypothetical protein
MVYHGEGRPREAALFAFQTEQGVPHRANSPN